MSHVPCVHTSQGNQKRELDVLEPELQVVVSDFMWMPGTEPRSSTEVASVPNYEATSVVPHFPFLLQL